MNLSQACEGQTMDPPATSASGETMDPIQSMNPPAKSASGDIEDDANKATTDQWPTLQQAKEIPGKRRNRH